MAALLHWGLRRVPIFYKVLVANVLLVVLGAVCGTWLTIEQARARPDLQPLELVATFAIIGSALSTAINAVILRLALMPLDELERTAKAVQAGDLEARVVLGPISDPHTDRLAATLNSMLDLVAAKARAIERYSEHLQQLSAKVIRAQEDERKRIALELHDETGQALTSLAIGLRVLQGAKTLDEACSQAEELLRLTHRALDGVHNLALELRPKTLDDLGLV
ncbi:MAG TPA: histidine kinase, partial [Chloroflexota bacterium]